MKAIAIAAGDSQLRLVDRPEPAVVEPDQVKLKMIRVGICGTDRELAAGGHIRTAEGRPDLIIGHEMFGQVVQAGRSVTRVRPGDYAVLTVRRGCGKCLPCAMNRSDMCRTGEYGERGIWGLDGFQAEFVVDKEDYAVRVPPELEPVGVLTEPLSVSEKAIDEAVRLQTARLPDAAATPDWLCDRRCLVAGLGPIGLLAALALRLRGADVYGLDIVDADTPRPQWLATIGGKYIDARQTPPDRLDGAIGPLELVLEATGAVHLEFSLLKALGPNGVYGLIGVPGGHRSIEIPGEELTRQMVLKNQAMFGTVNAARDHLRMAVDDLGLARLRWGDHASRLITHRHPVADWATVLDKHGADEIKVVIEWAA